MSYATLKRLDELGFHHREQTVMNASTWNSCSAKYLVSLEMGDSQHMSGV